MNTSPIKYHVEYISDEKVSHFINSCVFEHTFGEPFLKHTLLKTFREEPQVLVSPVMVETHQERSAPEVDRNN